MAGFSTIDYLVVVIYLIGTVWLGLRFTRGQQSLERYFMAARSAPWWAVGISIIATNLSAITYLGSPAWVFKHDLQYDLGVVAVPLTMLLVVYLFVPFLARLRLFTIYEYLEHRFDLASRTFASSLFLLMRGGWLATATYAQGLALGEITGWHLWSCIWLVGGVTAIYTIFGGIEAVLWTDVMQFFVLVGGIFVMLIVALIPFGGNFGEVWRIASEGGNTRMFNFSLNPTIEITFWGVIIGRVVGDLCSYGSDQVIVQRYMTTGSKKEMAKAILFNGVLVVPIVVGIGLLGLAFVAYYKMHPALNATLTNADRVVPHFITNVLPTGLAGLVLAGILAATMSSLSSGYNSLSTATMMDFYKRYRRKEVAEDKDLRTARLCTLFWAAGSTAVAMFIGQLGNLVQIIGKISGFFSGPLLGMFLLGLLTSRANSRGVMGGVIFGILVNWAVSTFTPISWLWYSVIGCFATLFAGYLLSLLSPAPPPESIFELTINSLGGPKAAEPFPTADSVEASA